MNFLNIFGRLSWDSTMIQSAPKINTITEKNKFTKSVFCAIYRVNNGDEVFKLDTFLLKSNRKSIDYVIVLCSMKNNFVFDRFNMSASSRYYINEKAKSQDDVRYDIDM